MSFSTLMNKLKWDLYRALSRVEGVIYLTIFTLFDELVRKERCLFIFYYFIKIYSVKIANRITENLT